VEVNQETTTAARYEIRSPSQRKGEVYRSVVEWLPTGESDGGSDREYEHEDKSESETRPRRRSRAGALQHRRPADCRGTDQQDTEDPRQIPGESKPETDKRDEDQVGAGECYVEDPGESRPSPYKRHPPHEHERHKELENEGYRFETGHLSSAKVRRTSRGPPRGRGSVAMLGTHRNLPRSVPGGKTRSRAADAPTIAEGLRRRARRGQDTRHEPDRG
jgi:hypothetical protein